MFKPGAFPKSNWHPGGLVVDAARAGERAPAAAAVVAGPSWLVAFAAAAPAAGWLALALAGGALAPYLPAVALPVPAGLDLVAAFVLAAAAFALSALPAGLPARRLQWLAAGLVLHGLVRFFAGDDLPPALIPLALMVLLAVDAAWRRGGGAGAGWLALPFAVLAVMVVPGLLRPWLAPAVLPPADLARLVLTLGLVVVAMVELHRIAAERAAALAAERERVERLGRLVDLRAELTRTLAHELGSPIAAIHGFTDVLALPDLAPADRTMAVAAVRSEAELLKRLVADMRTTADFRQDTFAVQAGSTPLRPLLADAVAFASTLPGDHPVVADLEGAGVRVRVDVERIAQVLRNLLANAARYSPPGTEITLRAQRVANHVRIEVGDHGPGIPRDDLERIFGKFERGRQAGATGTEGLGLGLYVSREIVRAHGAELAVRSVAGEGSVFGFELEVVR